MADSISVATFRDKLRVCPSCGKKLDGTTCIGDDDPRRIEPGDVTICAYCYQLLFTTEEGFRVATKEELSALDAGHYDEIKQMRDTLIDAADGTPH